MEGRQIRHGDRRRRRGQDGDPGTATRADGVRIGAQLRAARLAARKSMAEVADEAGLTKGFVSKLERDLANVSVASLIRLCDALGRLGRLAVPGVQGRDRPPGRLSAHQLRRRRHARVPADALRREARAGDPAAISSQAAAAATRRTRCPPTWSSRSSWPGGCRSPSRRGGHARAGRRLHLPGQCPAHLPAGPRRAGPRSCGSSRPHCPNAPLHAARRRRRAGSGRPRRPRHLNRGSAQRPGRRAGRCYRAR